MATYTRLDLDRTAGGIEGDTVFEDFQRFIYMISPTITPAIVNFDVENAEDDITYWQINTLRASAGNAYVDGAASDSAREGGRAPFKLHSPCQIMREELRISRRARIVNGAGREDELGYQMALKGLALRLDMERQIVVGNSDAAAAGGATGTPAFPPTAAVYGTTSVAPLTPCLNTCLYSNTYRATGAGTTDGADGALNGGGGTFGTWTTAATDASPDNQEALAEETILSILESCYVAGGMPSMLMCGTTMKTRISNYMFTSSARIASQQQDHGATPNGGLTVAGAVDVFKTDFGTLQIVPNREQRNQDIFILDTSMWAVRYLDSFRREALGKDGDSYRELMTVDWALTARNEAASGGIFDINSATPMITDTTPVT